MEEKPFMTAWAAKMPWVTPVGRLDKDTSGLLLLTNDTDFANHVTDPASQVPKTYLVKANMLVSDEVLAQLAQGIELKRGDWAQPQSVRRVEDRGKYSWLEIVLTEGKNREVRRLLEAVGLEDAQAGPDAHRAMHAGRPAGRQMARPPSLGTLPLLCANQSED